MQQYLLWLDAQPKKGIVNIVPLPKEQIVLLKNGQYEWNQGNLTFENWQIAEGTEIDKIIKIHEKSKKIS